MRNIYIYLVASKSVVSKSIKLFTYDDYTHIGISVDDDLDHFYSFARRYSRFPVPAGFEKESLNKGIYQLYPNTACKILSLEIPNDTYLNIKAELEMMHNQKDILKYNILGLLLCQTNITIDRKNKFFCSEFVSELLIKHNLLSLNKPPQHTKPLEIIDLLDSKLVFEGTIAELNLYKKMNNYTKQEIQSTL